DPPPQKERIEVWPLPRGDGREPRLAEERAGQEVRQEHGEPEGPRPHPRGALQGGAEEGGIDGREVRESDGHGLMAFDPDAAAADPRVVQWNAEAKRIAQSVIAHGGAVDEETRRAAAEVDEFGERLNGWVYEQTRALLDAGKIAITLGGDHSVPFGAIRAYAE